MGIFDNMLQKLGFGGKEEESKPERSAPADLPAEKAAAPRPSAGSASAPQGGSASAPRAMPEVDVVSKLDKMAAENPQDLNWKTSIVDLMKLLDMDSSFESRKELAVELNCPAEYMEDSAQMNTWLHKTVLEKIAENGGNVPKELLD